MTEDEPLGELETSRDPGIELFEGTRPSLSFETQQLLRTRLRALVVLLASAVGLFLLRDLFGLGPVEGFWHVGLMGALVASLVGFATLLSSHTSLDLRQLRALELVVLAVEAAWMASNQYLHTTRWAQQGNESFVEGQIDSIGFSYFALIVTYGVVIPNTWRRSLRVTGLLALVPFAVLFVFQIGRPDLALSLSTADLVTLGIEVSIAMMLALACTHMIHTLRTAAFEARQLGQYRLTDKIGSGGMGEVWKAEHRFLARPAAIKLVRPGTDASDSEAARNLLRRFEREAQATASLRSVHTIELYDFGISDEGVFYYVMELLDGLDLERLVTRFGPLPDSRAVFLLRQVCESLAEAHERGLVHRDIKPANIHTCRMGGRWDFVKVLDFGLVIADHNDVNAETRLTMEGTLAGTPTYMSPEAVVGETELGARSDIYSLGCVGYWLLTGELVFEGSTPMAIALAHAKDAPIPLSQRTELQVSPGIERAILACLEKCPSDRPSAEELGTVLAGCQVRNEWNQQRARNWWETHMPSDKD